MYKFSNKLAHALKNVVLATFLSVSCGSLLFSDQIAVSTFKLLNSNENSTIIDPAEAQDLLNVDVSPSGKSVKKRSGYGLYKTVFSPSTGVHGGYHAFDSTGNDVQIWASSVSVKGVVADGTPNTIVSSMTVNSTLACADTQGSIYCVDSNRDFFIRTNGTTLTQWYTSPLGTMIASTPDRIVVAGVAASPNTLFVSQSNTFTNFTTGVNATDAFTEVIASPGSHLTHIRWGCQKLLWWKDQSFGYFDFDDQYSAQVKIVSDNIGTQDNTSAVDPGGNVWFRGQDGHTYKYDCSGLSRETVDITPQIQSSGRRTTNLWQQTSQSDWQSGSIVPTNQLSTTLSIGDIVSSSFSTSEYSSASGWGSGTSSNMSIGTSSISLVLNNSGTGASNPGAETCPSPDGAPPTGWTTTGGGFGNCSAGFTTRSGCSMAPESGSYFFGNAPDLGLYACNFTPTITADILSVLNNTVIASDSFTMPDTNCAWTTRTISAGSNIGKRVYMRFTVLYASGGGCTHAVLYSTNTTSAFILGGDISYKFAGDIYNTGANYAYTPSFDNIQNGSSTITSGSFTSQLYDTTVGTSTAQITNFTYTSNTSTPTFGLVTSQSTSGPFQSVITSSGTNGTVFRYVKFVSTIPITSADTSVLSYISSFTIIARSSGTFYSAVKNAPNITAWSTFNPTFSNGDGSHTFYMRSSSNTFTVLSSTPVWTSQTANAQVIVTTYTNFQVRDDFAITAATNTPTLNDFLVNWFEGAASDQAYMLYFDNAIWESVAYGVGVSSNNYIFRRDLINDGWGLYYFGANGMLIQGNRLFFGSVTNGDVYQFGSGTSDNGSAINAYWKSKDFTGNDPFIQNQLTQVDTFAKKNQNQTLTATYSLDTSTTTNSYSISLSTASSSITQSRKLLPSGKTGYTFNIQYGDNSTGSAWELLGFRIGYVTNPYRPSQ